jgi:hypothetical protein
MIDAFDRGNPAIALHAVAAINPSPGYKTYPEL